jgi:regulator of PEP synthase PpsR (kinase-PPPase family)
VLTIFVVSDATGETADRVARAALVQFPQADVTVIRRGQVRTGAQLRAVVDEAAAAESLIIHTLVSDELRGAMLAEARRCGVDALDLMGPVLDRLTHHLQTSPQEKPGLYEQLAEVRARGIEAVEFAFRHDDGQHPEDLARAEVVLVGPSRTMKTPTTLFLAYRGWFVANVPLVPGTLVPSALTELPAERIFCLNMSASRLVELRRARAIYLGIPNEPYASLSSVREELRLCQAIRAAHGWRGVDVTGKSVEEVAREIMLLRPGVGPSLVSEV